MIRLHVGLFILIFGLTKTFRPFSVGIMVIVLAALAPIVRIILPTVDRRLIMKIVMHLCVPVMGTHIVDLFISAAIRLCVVLFVESLGLVVPSIPLFLVVRLIVPLRILLAVVRLELGLLILVLGLTSRTKTIFVFVAVLRRLGCLLLYTICA